jgi:hypothetical protein
MGGLLRGMARTAVVAGTATAVSNRVSRRQAGRWAAQDAQSQAEQGYQQQGYQQQAYQQGYQEPVQATPPPAGTDMDTKLAQLKELAQLKQDGILSEAEFETQKARILNG